MPHPSEQVEIKTATGTIDIQFDNYYPNVIRLAVFEDGPHGNSAIAKLTYSFAREVAYRLLEKADWLADCAARARIPED